MTTARELRAIVAAGPYRCATCGVLMDYPDEHDGWDVHPTAVEVVSYPEEWLHLHGKALSGVRHSHPLREGEDRDDPDHEHEGSENRDEEADSGTGRAIYWEAS